MGLLRDWSVRTRLTWVATIVTALACVGVSALVFMGAHSLAVAQRIQDIILADLHVSHMIKLRRLKHMIPDQDISAVQVLDETGRIIATTRNMAGRELMPSFTPPDTKAVGHTLTCSSPGFPDDCVHVVVMRHYRDTGNLLIYGADPTIPWFVHPALFALLTATALTLVGITAYGTYRVVNRTLAPVDALRAELAEITASDLSRRVPLPPHRDELRGLAETVNQTLDRLQQAVERQRRFASDASHDLRSPITAMRAQVEDALANRDDADWSKAAEAMTGSLDRLQAIVSDLLVIARLDSEERVTRDYIDLAELVRGETGRRSRGKRLVADLRPGVIVSGDRLQLARLLTNLLDNGERHAASTVTVRLRREGGDAVMEVIDDGEGIRPEHREVVFQRFTRLAAGREKDAQGTGLGLAIAREIAQRHEGTLTIEDSPRGARFVLRMPTLP
ncbi:HAMP domain-containing sensor histidine kinase [Sphaerisporangium sp. NPDC051011]|uniref:sensor histidine kinase n=1 Tax=Sphaerisporangium sp. NPDC051011 TaxID=3155792 RepID=UPI0033C5E56A